MALQLHIQHDSIACHVLQRVHQTLVFDFRLAILHKTLHTLHLIIKAYNTGSNTELLEALVERITVALFFLA